MKNKLFALAALSSLLVTLPAMAETTTDSKSETKIESTSNGGYTVKDKAEKTDPNGTVTTEESTKDVDVDSKGNKTTKVDIKNTSDPKGLFNKQTTEIKNKSVDKDGKSEYSHKKTVNGTDVEDMDKKTSPVSQ
jgi:hypothetical protein